MTIPPARILVVDDEDAGRFVKARVLRRAGFLVNEAATGTDALRSITDEPPDLVVLDVNLPDISGLEVTRRIRATEAGPPTLQILQMSHTAVQNSDRVRGLEQGADVYLTEPVDASVLVATVHALLRVRKAETDLAAALERERHARELAEHANRLKDEFIATLSHELRTPLNALMGWIWQLRHTTLGDKAYVRALDSLERNTRLQAQLINDLLDVSRASKGKLQIEIRLIDLRTVVTLAAEFLAEPLEGKRFECVLPDSPVAVAGDPARLQQIATNLLTNAVQFTPPDGRITVTVSVDNDDAVMTISDSGAGIDPAFLPHVFDQFRQGEGGLTRKHGGLGLGLAVVQQLVALQGGSVDVTSPGAGRGTTFIVRIPHESTIAPSPLEDTRPILDGVSVSIVSDNGDAMGMRAILESSGAHVDVVAGQPASTASGPTVVIEQRGSTDLRVMSASTREHRATVSQLAPPGEIVRQVWRASR